jgi:hypothetical protein
MIKVVEAGRRSGDIPREKNKPISYRILCSSLSPSRRSEPGLGLVSVLPFASAASLPPEAGKVGKRDQSAGELQ